MPLDASIITNMQQPDLSGAINSAVQMRSLANENQLRSLQVKQAQQAYTEQQNQHQAAQNNISVGDDGTSSFNQKGYLSDLGQSSTPWLVPAEQLRMTQQQMQMQNDRIGMLKTQNEFIGQLAGGVKDQATLDYAHNAAQKAGMDTSQYPTTYDPIETPKVMANLQMRSLNANQQLDQMNKQQEMGIKQQGQNIETQKLGLELKKNSATQNQETLQAMQALRGNPALQRAETNVLSAKNLNDLAEQLRDPQTGQIDLSKANPQQVSLWNHELLRMASGGSGSEADLENLKPGTPQYKMAELRQKLTGKVSGADAAPYLQQGLDYANTLGKSSQQFLYQNAKGVVDAKRAYLTPQDAAQWDNKLNAMKNGTSFFGDVVGGSPSPIQGNANHPALQGKSLAELQAMKAAALSGSR